MDDPPFPELSQSKVLVFITLNVAELIVALEGMADKSNWIKHLVFSENDSCCITWELPKLSFPDDPCHIVVTFVEYIVEVICPSLINGTKQNM